MQLSQKERDFVSFVLKKFDTISLLDATIARCEREDIAPIEHFREGLMKQYQYSSDQARDKVREWLVEFNEQQKPLTPPPVFVEQPAAKPQPKQEAAQQTTIISPPPVARKRSSAAGWIIGILLLGGIAAAGYFFWWKNREGDKRIVYVLAEDGVVIREKPNVCDTSNHKLGGIAYNQEVEILDTISPNSNWWKVSAIGELVDGSKGPIIGYVAEHRMLGLKADNQRLDSIYMDRVRDAKGETVNYPLKKALYSYIKNAGFAWYVQAVQHPGKYQSVVELSRDFGTTKLNNCELTNFRKYRVVIIKRRDNQEKKALLFSLTNDYTCEIVGEQDLTEYADPIFFIRNYQRADGVMIVDGRNSDSNPNIIFTFRKNGSGLPTFVKYEKQDVPNIIDGIIDSTKAFFRRAFNEDAEM
jgi:hypothetical protein